MKQEIAQIVSVYCGADQPVELTRPDVQFGDYSTNIALQLAGKLKKNPRQIATDLAAKFEKLAGVDEVSVAGPGFINLRLTDQALIEDLANTHELERQGKVVVIETNNPNPFKAMHIGH